MAKLVNWGIFEKKLKERKLLIFTPLDIRRIFDVSKVAASFLLHRYTQREFLIRLKRGLYVIYDADVPDLYLANKLYEPSYISLEFALSYHRIIPETVYDITSVTPKATRRFTALNKVFTYRCIKKEAFTGYSTNQQRGLTFIIAEPEKAFVDLTYLRVIRNKKPISRFNKEKINPTKALRYAKLFDNKKVISVIKRTLQ